MPRIPVVTGTKTGTRFLPCRADFCSLPQRAGTGLHRVALVLTQQNKLVPARQNERAENHNGHHVKCGHGPSRH
jgi:hypothetical protein